jgi:hypothetical protein
MSWLQVHLTPLHIHFHVYFSLTCLSSPCTWNCDSRLLCLCELYSLLFSFAYIQLQYPSSLRFIFAWISAHFSVYMSSSISSICYVFYPLLDLRPLSQKQLDFCLFLGRTEFSCTVQFFFKIPDPLSFSQAVRDVWIRRRDIIRCQNKS